MNFNVWFLRESGETGTCTDGQTPQAKINFQFSTWLIFDLMLPIMPV